MLPTKEKNSIGASALEHSTALANKVLHDAIRHISDTNRKENKTLVNKPLDKVVYFRVADLTRLHNCILSTFTKHLVKDMEIKVKQQVSKSFFTKVFLSVLDRLTSALLEFISWNGQRFLVNSRSTVSGPPSNLTTDVDRTPLTVVASKCNKKRRIIQPQLQEKHVCAIYTPSSLDVFFSSVLGEESEKWELLADLLKTDYFLSIIRLDDCSARESMGEALGISCALSLPPAVSYSLLDVSNTSQYIHGRRTLAYRMQIHSGSLKDRLSYPLKKNLEVAWELKAKKKLSIMDSTLNEELVDAILASCYGIKFGDESSKNMSLESNSQDIDRILGQYEHITPAEKNVQTSNICFVQVPPGTGKTRITIAVIKIMARIASMPHILVMTATNDASDGIQEQLEIVILASPCMYKTVRVGRGSKVPVAMELNLHTLAEAWQKKRRSCGNNTLTREQIFKYILRTEKIFFTTFDSAAVLKSEDPGFDMLVVEEASCISEAQFLFACNLAFGGASFPYSEKTIPPASHQITVVIRDHKQLPPHSNVPPYFPRALQDHFFTRGFSGEYNASPKGLVRHVLKKKYRMHPAIANMVGKISYEDKLETPNQLVRLVLRGGDSNFTNTIEKWDGFNLSIVSFIDTSPEGVAAKELSSAGALIGYSNPTEAFAITGILVHRSSFVKPKDLADNVVVLCAYTRQEKEIRTQLEKEGLDSIGVKVETVDSFKGRECNIVLLSLVRIMDLGFLRNLRRVNFARSLARKRLVIVGYGKNFSDRSTEWKSILSIIYNESFSDESNYGFFRILRTPGTVRNIPYTKYTPITLHVTPNVVAQLLVQQKKEISA